MGYVVLFLAKGFEEIEALMPIDILRRGGVEVKTMAIDENDIVIVKGAHGISVEADMFYDRDTALNADMIILPGGGDGTENLDNHEDIGSLLIDFNNRGKYIAAICAAPSILGKRGILKGKKAVCYSGFEKFLEGAVITDENVVYDGNIITSKSMGVSMEFAFTLLEILKGEETVISVKKSLML